jgi:hypothetical protein
MSSLAPISFNNSEESIDVPIENLSESFSTDVYLSTPSQKHSYTAESTQKYTQKPLDLNLNVEERERI